LVPPVAVDAARYRQQGQGKRIAIRFLAASPGLEIVTSRQTFAHRRHGVVAVFLRRGISGRWLYFRIASIMQYNDGYTD
jgi:hypothetical protein